MKLLIEIKMESDAFKDDALAEVSRILRDYSNKILLRRDAIHLDHAFKDINGISVGRAVVVK